MTLPASITLESLIKDNTLSLEIFKFDDEDSQIDRSRHLPIPTDIVSGHMHKIINSKTADAKIKGEFKFLYNSSTKEAVLMPTSNYKKIVKISKNAKTGIQAKKFIEYFANKENVLLRFLRGKYIMEGIPIEYRPIGRWIKFIAENEPYIHVQPVITYSARHNYLI